MFSFWVCQNSRATVTHTRSIKFSGLWPGKNRAPTLLLHLFLSLKQINKNPVLMENYWRYTPHCSPAGCPQRSRHIQGAAMWPKILKPHCACMYIENNPTLLTATSTKKINHTFQTRKITRVYDETEQASWYTGDYCLSCLSSFLQRESTWQ